MAARLPPVLGVHERLSTNAASRLSHFWLDYGELAAATCLNPADLLEWIETCRALGMGKYVCR
jgi:hypothetical protein